ncbi:MAG: response regulator transcription factor [Gammaproteobacteria bacterium]|nr:response regulator transcription factor [Gammaproteobacteria bacterium]
MRLLVIEDEPTLLTTLAARLREDGYAVDIAANGRDGHHIGAEYPIDLAIVDLGLPDITGTEVIKRWRASGLAFPVLILTARGSWEDKVAGLELGADDYLVKPFHTEELLARVRALMRRAAGWSDPKLRCGPFVLDTSAKSFTVDDKAVELTAFEYKVLEYLMLHAGRVVSKTELTDHLYEEDTDRDSNVLEVIVGRLRRKLDPERTLNPVETSRGQGYRFRFERAASRPDV